MFFLKSLFGSLKQPAATASRDAEKAACEAKANQAKTELQAVRNQPARLSDMSRTPEPEMPDVEVSSDFLRRLAANRRAVAALEKEIKMKDENNK